jgi:hypothetical protein
VTWSTAFRRQAAADFGLFQSLANRDSTALLCHRLQLLQMATEKLAKSYSCKGSAEPPKRTHLALVGFLRTIASNPVVRRHFEFGDRHRDFSAYIKKLLPIADKVEALAPVGNDVEKPNPEYPWRNPKEEVLCPADYSFSEFTKTELARFVRFIDQLLRLDESL